MCAIPAGRDSVEADAVPPSTVDPALPLETGRAISSTEGSKPALCSTSSAIWGWDRHLWAMNCRNRGSVRTSSPLSSHAEGSAAASMSMEAAAFISASKSTRYFLKNRDKISAAPRVAEAATTCRGALAWLGGADAASKRGMTTLASAAMAT